MRFTWSNVGRALLVVGLLVMCGATLAAVAVRDEAGSLAAAVVVVTAGAVALLVGLLAGGLR